MVDIIEIARALSNAPIPAEEKRAWKDAIPHMPDEEVEKLVAALNEHSQEIERLRSEYLSKAQEVVDQEEAEKMTEQLSS